MGFWRVESGNKSWDRRERNAGERRMRLSGGGESGFLGQSIGGRELTSRRQVDRVAKKWMFDAEEKFYPRSLSIPMVLRPFKIVEIYGDFLSLST